MYLLNDYLHGIAFNDHERMAVTFQYVEYIRQNA